jgi:hypothetical protein
MLFVIVTLLHDANSVRFMIKVADSLIFASCNDSGMCDQSCFNLQVQTLFRGPPYHQFEALF